MTSSGVLAVALLGGALAATTVVLAARLVAGRRASEAALLSARGTGRARLVGQAAAESGALAVLAIVPATVLALALYQVLADAVGLDPEGIPEGGLLPLVGSVTAVTLTLGALLVLPWLRTGTPRGTREDRVGVVARSGADLLLLALAALAFLQLRAHRVAGGSTADPVLVVAPVLCLLAGAALVLRPLPLLARRAEARAASARSLTLPLAAWGVARRPQGAAAAFLVVLATACATFGIGFAATWAQSQRDQAAAAVGTDLSVPAQLDALGAGATLRAATGGRVSPRHEPAHHPRLASAGRRRGRAARRGRHAGRRRAAARPAAVRWLGRRHVGPGADRVRRRASRLPGTSADLVVTGHVEDDVPITAALSLVVQDRDGARAALPAGAVALDGAPHDLAVAVPPDVRVVAVDARLAAAGDAADPDQQSSAGFDIDVTCATRPCRPGGTWSPARPPSSDYVVAALDRITAVEVPDGVRLTLHGTAYLPGLYWSEGTLTALAFDPVDDVPVVVSARLADELGLEVGDGVQLALGLTPVRREGHRHRRLHPLAATCGGAAGRRGHAVPRHPQPGQPRDADRRVVGRRRGARRAAATLAAEGIGPVTDRTAVAHENVGRSPARGAAGGGRPAGGRRHRAHARRDRAAHHDLAGGARGRRGPPARPGRAAPLGAQVRARRAGRPRRGAGARRWRCWVPSPAGPSAPCWRSPPRGCRPCRPRR